MKNDNAYPPCQLQHIRETKWRTFSGPATGHDLLTLADCVGRLSGEPEYKALCLYKLCSNLIEPFETTGFHISIANEQFVCVRLFTALETLNTASLTGSGK